MSIDRRHSTTHFILHGTQVMNHSLRCRCGTLRGYVSHPEDVNRGVCYCKDCQAFAHFLETADSVLDSAGGTEVIQTTPANVTITQGQSKLACVRLRNKGLLRWYTSCCKTPDRQYASQFPIRLCRIGAFLPRRWRRVARQFLRSDPDVGQHAKRKDPD